jgi:hypothetical protein
MSPRAITARLKRVSQLRRLGLLLGKAKITKPQGNAGKSTTTNKALKSK